MPFLAQTDTVHGPGGGSLITGPKGGEWLVYHGRKPGYEQRTLRIDPFSWSNERPVVDSPTSRRVSLTP